jgi:hypothetical protein
VLSADDDSLPKGRQLLDPAWRPEDVPRLPQLLDPAANAGRIVVLTGDHGDLLEHGSEHRQHTGGGARWRPDGGTPKGDEVVVSGPRVLVSEGRAILAATEDARYGKRVHAYHGAGSTRSTAACSSSPW